MNTDNRLEKFEKWIRCRKQRDGQNYADATVRMYCDSLASKAEKIASDVDFHRNLFAYDDPQKFSDVMNAIRGASNYEEVNRRSYNGALSAAMELYRVFLLNETEVPSCWIFQANPKYYDIRLALANGENIRWGVPQFFRQIRKGDRVFIWVAGENAGIEAVGEVLNAPQEVDREMDDPYMRGERLKAGKGWAVDVKILEKPVRPVLRTELRLDARTKGMTILRYPGTTVFSVTREEQDVIESMMDGSYVQEPVAEVFAGTASSPRYWMYAPGEQAVLWDEFWQKGIMGIGWEDLEDLSQYDSPDAVRAALRTAYHSDASYRNWVDIIWKFCREMKVGDVVYAKQGNYRVIGRGVVTSDYQYDASRQEFPNVRKVRWTHAGVWELDSPAAMKSLTDITWKTGLVQDLEERMTGGEVLEDMEEAKSVVIKPYTKEDFLQAVFMREEEFERLRNLLGRKKNVILQGAPGVGKSHAAQRLAYALMGEEDAERVKAVQFHQSYSYEDFMMGYRPRAEGGFLLETGPFYEFCRKAQDDLERSYYFIIDEINRANVSRVFGELLLLIEAGKREETIRMLYRDERFYVPRNVYLIGMMNTADRSLALIDYALRRRFAFFEMEPAFDSPGFQKKREAMSNEHFGALVDVVKALNEEIAKDPALGRGFRIGHSYFCMEPESGACSDAELKCIVDCELVPLLEEYWVDDADKLNTWKKRLNDVFRDQAP